MLSHVYVKFMNLFRGDADVSFISHTDSQKMSHGTRAAMLLKMLPRHHPHVSPRWAVVCLPEL